MCGIIGYVGNRQASPVLLDGLRRLEYRGYDSAGVAILDEARIDTRKKQGKIDEGLAKLIQKQAIVGHLGIGDIAVAVYVSSSHRQDAFAACRFLIDEIKSRVPVWKREHFTDGTAEWLAVCPGCHHSHGS